MTQYIIRTKKEEKRTYLFHMGQTPECLAMLYTDFYVRQGMRAITLEDAVNPRTHRELAKIQLYTEDAIISVMRNNREISGLTMAEEYREDGIIVPCTKLTKPRILSKEEYTPLEELGVTHAYVLGDKSSLSQVFCFEREGDLAGIVFIKDRKDHDPVLALKALPLVLAERIIAQDYLFEFVRT
ncbi:MAG: hypothetical protein V1743_08150 [Nanoarchaeota archaeon]